MEKYYIGGSLFTEKQIKQRLYEEQALKDLIDDIEIYNPISNDEINDKTKEPTAKDIFNQDTKEIISSDVILADLDDEDMGLAMELGIAYMANYMRDEIKAALESEAPRDKLDELLDRVPEKRVYAVCSDIRQDTNNEEGIYKSWGQNQYVVGGIQEMGYISNRLSDSLAAIYVDGVIHG